MAQNFYSETISTVPVVQKIPTLEWLTGGTVNKTPTLEWYTFDVFKEHPTLSWITKPAPIFCPNLINYTYDYLEPSIISKKFTSSVYGCLFGYSVNFDNTGSTGTTEIKIYINKILKRTISILATNKEYIDTYKFTLTDEIEVFDEIEIEVSSVATDTEGLRFNVLQMSFPFALDKPSVANLDANNTVLGIAEGLVFNTADYWTLEFNQPIGSIDTLVGTTFGGEKINLTFTIEDGNFKDSQIRIVPYTSKRLVSLNIDVDTKEPKAFSFSIPINHNNNYLTIGNYQELVSQELILLIQAKTYQYSFDNINWSSKLGIVDRKVIIDFTGESEGNTTTYLKYTVGTTEVTETFNLTLVGDTIDCKLEYTPVGFSLLYYDVVPFDRVDIYEGSTLLDTLQVPLFYGFKTVTTNDTNLTINLASGYTYYGGAKYIYETSTYTLTTPVGITEDSTRYVVTFYFDSITKKFVWVEEKEGNKSVSDPNSNSKIPIFSTVFTLIGQSYFYVKFEDASKLFYKNQEIPLDTINNVDLTIKVVDVANRELNFYSKQPITQYATWRIFTVTDTSDNVMLPGQIHSEIDLKYNLESEEYT